MTASERVSSSRKNHAHPLSQHQQSTIWWHLDCILCDHTEKQLRIQVRAQFPSLLYSVRFSRLQVCRQNPSWVPGALPASPQTHKIEFLWSSDTRKISGFDQAYHLFAISFKLLCYTQTLVEASSTFIHFNVSEVLLSLVSPLKMEVEVSCFVRYRRSTS